MTKLYTSILVFFVTLPLFAQKISVQVAKSKNASGSEWQILERDFLPVISGNEFPGLDSVSFGLEENTRYFIEVSVSEVYKTDTCLIHLYINSEPVLLIKSDLLPGDHYYTFFTGVRQHQAKITGGTDADIADFPWQVFYEAGGFTCGGSIISGNWIVTAAHCTEDDYGNLISASQMDVIVGANNPRSGLEGKKYIVSKVIRHEKYNPVSLLNDIALLQLSENIDYPNATPIRLVSKIDSAGGATDPGVMSWVTGYGYSSISPKTIPVTLQKVQLPVISLSQASTVWSDIPATDLMAGFKDGNKDACNGDSGGPLVVPFENGYKLAGLVSWGSSSCDTYGAYTRLSTFETWINSKTGIEISYVPPVPAGDSIVCKGNVSSIYNVGTITGASSYEWQLLPVAAGTINGNSGQATVNWDQGYIGAATVRLRVTKFNIVSYWSALTVHIAEYNSLTGKSNDTTLCAGNPLTLKVEAKGYNLDYSWYKDGRIVKSGRSPELVMRTTSVDSTGIYRCDISGSCGEPVSPLINLTVLPVTVIKNLTPDTKVLFDENVTLEVESDGHNMLYQWLKDDKQIAAATAPVYYLPSVNAENTGLYRVDIKGTCGEVLSNTVYLYVTSNEKLSGPEVFVWPTVVSSGFNVALSTDQSYNLQIFSINGRLVKIINNCQYKTAIDLSNIPTGVYLISVYGNNFHKTVKVIKN